MFVSVCATDGSVRIRAGHVRIVITAQPRHGMDRSPIGWEATNVEAPKHVERVVWGVSVYGSIGDHGCPHRKRGRFERNCLRAPMVAIVRSL